MSRTVEDILGAFQGDRRERGGFWPRWQSIGNRPETDTGDIKAFVRGLQWIGRGHTPVCMRGDCVFVVPLATEPLQAPTVKSGDWTKSVAQTCL